MDPDGASSRSRFVVFLDTPLFVGRPFAMLPRLVDHGGSQQLCGIEFANREPLQPCLLTTGQAVKLRPTHVP
jgi:hypothetical protein